LHFTPDSSFDVAFYLHFPPLELFEKSLEFPAFFALLRPRFPTCFPFKLAARSDDSRSKRFF
jgi:hypothetical protein